MIFDCEICDWSIGTSTFDKHIFNKEKLTILIETIEENAFGGHINEKMNNHDICDSQSILFSFKDNQSVKYEMKEERKKEPIFSLSSEEENKLFVFGNGEM